MKNFFILLLISLLFSACSSKEALVINKIPAKTTHVKADAPGEPVYKGNPNSVYDDGNRRGYGYGYGHYLGYYY